MRIISEVKNVEYKVCAVKGILMCVTDERQHNNLSNFLIKLMLNTSLYPWHQVVTVPLNQLRETSLLHRKITAIKK